MTIRPAGKKLRNRRGKASLAEKSEDAEYLLEIDSLRGIAACVVAFIVHQHFMLGNTAEPLRGFWLGEWLYEHGEIAVDLFFVISGFVFAHIYLQSAASRAVSARDFFVARFARLYPLHIATALFIFMLAPFFGYVDWPATPSDGYHLLLHSFFLQMSGLGETLSLNRPSWSLSVEVFCYFLFVIGLKLGREVFTKFAITMVLCGLILALPGHPVLLGLGRGLFGFFVGCLMYQNRALLEKSPVLFAPLIPLFGFLVFSPLHAGIVASATAWPVIVTLAPRCGLLRNRILKWLGERSYSIYLLHAPVFIVLSAAMFDNQSPPQDDTILICVLGVILTLVVSDVSFSRFEKPARKYLNKVLARRPESVIGPTLAGS
jgi:peptidoglycan/LPS O-acetylase OafA/YrhL